MKTTLITTVFNEEKNISKFLNSLLAQSVLPDEVVIVDGGSSDNTFGILNKKTKNIKKIKILLFKKRGNRSIGRNEAIKNASNNIILSTDVGCLLEKNWVKNLTSPFENKSVDVVAGYYKGISENAFQKSVIPYALVMPDKVNEDDFLPATRSMAFKKSVWKKAGGFDEKLSHNEDYVFANNLKKVNAKIVFSQKAIVYWIPRKNFIEAFIMFFRFSLGDAQSNIFRDKVIYIFLRYLLVAYLFFIGIVFKSIIFWFFYFVLLTAYLAWSIAKNYKYVLSLKAFLYLPLLQFLSDFAVILGTSTGIIQKFSSKKIVKVILNNKVFFSILLVYIISMISIIDWGIPNQYHPFNYHMDEWHFAQAIRAFLKYGTGSVSGAASIPLFHIVSSIIFLTPFYLTHLINPFAIKNSIDNIPAQQTLFEVLRLHTLFYGILSISLFFIILKKYIKLFPLGLIAIFTFTPLWIFLSNFYKYDITLTFWIIAAIYFILKFYKTEKFSNFIFAGISCGLALSTKFTALPLFIGYILSYFIFTKKIKITELFLAVLVTISTFLLIGIPDAIFGKGSYYNLLFTNLIQDPQGGGNFNLGYPAWFYLMFVQYPAIFGYFLMGITYLGTIYWTIVLLRETIKKGIHRYKIELFTYLIFVLFFLGLLSFNLGGTGNRALLALPFMILLSGLFIKNVVTNHKANFKKAIFVLVVLGLTMQILQSYAWESVKFDKNPRIESSIWLQKNIPVNTLIGIENIPIYQNLPDIALKEFYLKEHDKFARTMFKYSVISASSKQLPDVVIVAQDYNDVNYVKASPKKDLVVRLKKEKYKKTMVFSPDLRYYDLFADKITFLLIYAEPLTLTVYEK